MNDKIIMSAQVGTFLIFIYLITNLRIMDIHETLISGFILGVLCVIGIREGETK